MTVTRTLTVWCDNPECPEWVYVHATTVGEARREVREGVGGWHTVNPGVDICPACWDGGKRPPWAEGSSSGQTTTAVNAEAPQPSTEAIGPLCPPS